MIYPPIFDACCPYSLQHGSNPLRPSENAFASVEEEAEEVDTTRTEYLRDVIESRYEGKKI